MISRNKTIVGGVLGGTLVTILIIGLLPVIVYGSAVNVVAISYNPSFAMVPLASSADESSSPSSSGYDSFQLIEGTFEAEHMVINPYDYFAMKTNGNCIGSGTIIIESLYIYIYLYLTIINPLGEEIQYIFTLEDIAGDLSVDIVLGPDMIEIVEGTYQLSLISELIIEFDGETIYSGSLTASCSVDVVFKN